MQILKISLRRAGLITLGLFVGFALVEAVLQVRLYVVYKLRPSIQPFYIDDARLGQRPNPEYPDHGPGGWRNPQPLEKAEIVVFGDSQTYGVGLPPPSAWPHVLQSFVGKSVMQMASPGYSPGHYPALYDEARALSPSIVVVAYYFGNDLFGSYAIAHNTGDGRRSVAEPILDDLVTKDVPQKAAITQAERIDPGFLRALYLDCQLPRPVPHTSLQAVRDVLSLPELTPLTTSNPDGMAGSMLRQSALLSGIQRVVARQPNKLGLDAWFTGYGSPICVNYSDGQVTTVFSPGYRLLAVDHSDPRIVEGERVSLNVLKHLNDRSREDGRHFLVVLIPTKESAFEFHARGRMTTEPYMIELWEREAQARERALSFFRANNIAVVDSRLALSELLHSAINPYWETADGHPRAEGHIAIAKAVAQRLRADGLVH